MQDDLERVIPKQLFIYPGRDDDEILAERTKVVKDFCFPNGIEVIKLDYKVEGENDPDVLEIITDILYR